MVDYSIRGAHRSQPGVAPVYTDRQHGAGYSSSNVQVATVAELRAGIVAQADTYLVLLNGSYVLFAWDASSTAADDGQTCLQVTGVATGRYRRQRTPTASRTSGDRFWNDLSVFPIGVYDARFGVSATGGLVDSVADQSGCGSNATQTSTLRPTLSATGWSDGGPCITFGGAHYLACDGISGKLGANQPRTVVCLARLGVYLGANCLFNVSGADNTVLYDCYAGYASIFDTAWNNSDDLVFTTTEDKLVVWVHGNGAGVSHVWVDGKRYNYSADAMSGTPATVVHSTIGAHLAGGSYAPSQYITGALRHASIYSGLATAADVKEIYKRLTGSHFLRIVCDGNSLTSDRTGSGQGCYTTVLQRKLGAASLGYCRVSNLGIGGQNTENMITRYPTYAAPLYSDGADCVYVAWELSNHILAVASASDSQSQAVARCAAVVQRFWDLCAMARATGFRVVVVTATYREATGYLLLGGGYLASKAVGDACIDELNRLLRAGWASHADGLADVCAHPMFSNSANTSNTAIYPDGTHFSQTAHDVIAGIIYAAVRVQLDSMA